MGNPGYMTMADMSGLVGGGAENTAMGPHASVARVT